MSKLGDPKSNFQRFRNACQHSPADTHCCNQCNVELNLHYCDCRASMAESQLSAVLTAACLVLIFVVRKLGLVISQRDSLSTSQQAMLKQVHH